MHFKDVIGHKKLKEQLIKTVKDGRISHAQLFLGLEGSGNLAMALAYAQYVSCENKGDNDSCGTCKSCVKYNKLAHPDLHFVYPVNSTKSGTKVISDDFIKEWRECISQNPYLTPNQWYSYIGVENKQGIISVSESSEIIRKINLKTYESEYKVMVIWMAEKMNMQSANRLLKLIEEPPEKTLFLLVSESSEEIISTITSRTQLVKIPRIETNDLADVLQENHQLSRDQAITTAVIANGSYAKALDVLETSEANKYNLEKFIEIMRLSYSRKWPDIFQWVDEVSGMGREKIKQFLEFSLRLIRENMILNLKTEQLNYLTSAEKEFSSKFHPFINGRNVIQITQEFNQACIDIERNAYNKIVLLDMSLKLVKLIKR